LIGDAIDPVSNANVTPRIKKCLSLPPVQCLQLGMSIVENAKLIDKDTSLAKSLLNPL
jgi:hypothetical protein